MARLHSDLFIEACETTSQEPAYRPEGDGSTDSWGGDQMVMVSGQAI